MEDKMVYMRYVLHKYIQCTVSTKLGIVDSVGIKTRTNAVTTACIYDANTKWYHKKRLCRNTKEKNYSWYGGLTNRYKLKAET